MCLTSSFIYDGVDGDESSERRNFPADGTAPQIEWFSHSRRVAVVESLASKGWKLFMTHHLLNGIKNCALTHMLTFNPIPKEKLQAGNAFYGSNIRPPGSRRRF